MIVLFEIIFYLGIMQDAETVEIVAQLRSSPDRRLRLAAIRIYKKLPDISQAIKNIQMLLEDDDPEVRKEALAKTKYLKSPNLTRRW